MNGDILWAKITPCMQNGKSCIVDGLTNGIGFGSTEFHVIRVRDTEVSTTFVLEFVSQETVRHVATLAFTGSAGQQRVPASFLEELPFPKFSEARQNELTIAMDSARSERKAKLAEADALLASLDGFLLDALGIKPPPEDFRYAFAVYRRGAQQRFDPHFHSPEICAAKWSLRGTGIRPAPRRWPTRRRWARCALG